MVGLGIGAALFGGAGEDAALPSTHAATSTTTRAATSAASDATTASEMTTAAEMPTASEVPTEPDVTTVSDVTLSRVIDGDTIWTSAGKVRLIGIDSPELGQCGYSEAVQTLQAAVAVGDRVYLELPEGENDSDSYGRLLRYVTTVDGVDLGLMQLQGGHAVARYDSLDGYPEHPRQDAYHAAQVATLSADGTVVAVGCEVAAVTENAEEAGAGGDDAGDAVGAGDGDEWWTKYRSCAALKRNTVGDPTGPFSKDDPDQVEIYNWFQYGTGHRGDGDNDGLACE